MSSIFQLKQQTFIYVKTQINFDEEEKSLSKLKTIRIKARTLFASGCTFTKDLCRLAQNNQNTSRSMSICAV